MIDTERCIPMFADSSIHDEAATSPGIA